VSPDRDARRRRLAVLAVVGAAAAGVALALPGSSGSSRRSSAARGGQPAAASVTSAPSTPVAATASSLPAQAPGSAPASTTGRAEPRTTRPAVPGRAAAVAPTTTDPGTLPQTAQLPSASDLQFQARVQDLWRAVVDGNPTEALPFFFPLSAYIQIKAISDPVYDYQTRLIANFAQDVNALHATLGASAGSAIYTGVTVPAAAQWIVPGVEYNKGSYWRVYGTAISYLAGGERRSFPITSMISWRGEWYVVHLGAIR
jgi:hypothetical protein